MPNKNTKNMRVKRDLKKGKRNNTDECRLKFNIRLPDPSAASNVGSMVTTRYEIDTTLGTLLQELGDRFTFWKLNHLKIKLIPFNGSAVVGFHGICALPDPEDTTPGNFSDFCNQKDVKVGPLFNMNPLIYNYRPPGDGVTKWRYCKDIVTQADRLEMFGDLVYATSSTAVSSVLSIPMAEVDVSFRFPVITAINAIKPSSPQVGDTDFLTLRKYHESQRVDSFEETPSIIEMKSNGVPLGLRETISGASTGYINLRKPLR